jgi:putative ABC transport system permease protein
VRWPRFFRRRYWDEERARELQAYLEIETDENISRGMAPDDARYKARRKLGNSTLIREYVYQMNSIGFLETLWQDLRHGARLLRLNPGFTTVAILSLALGIGANTSIFQLFDAIRLRTLPVKNPQELVQIELANRDFGAGSFSGSHPALTNPLWEQLRDRQQAFSGTFAWGGGFKFNLSRGGEARLAEGVWVSGDFFNVLGVTPVAGRVFTPTDDRRSCGSPGAVISYAFWQREYGGDPTAIGRTLLLSGNPFEVIGITPAGFSGIDVGKSFDIALPLCSEPVLARDRSLLDQRHQWFLAAMGRLKPGWSVAQASAHLVTISPGLFEATVPTGYLTARKEYLTLKLGAFEGGTGISNLRDASERPLWLLLSITGLVLLIACANLANLMLARASAREKEIAVRLAIGASRLRLIRQLLAECLLLAVIGTVVGACVAPNLSHLLISLLGTEGNPIFIDLTMDWRVLAFTGGLAILTCLLFGLTPALRATRTEPGAVMKASGRGMTATREGYFGLRRILVVSQVALSLVLLVAALLFARSLRNLLTLDVGMRQDGILIAYLDLARLNLPADRYSNMKRELLERLQTIPGVESAADATIVPISGSSWTMAVQVTGAPADQKRTSRFNWVSPGFFKTMGIPIIAGRDAEDRDTATAPKVAIVNETFAKRLLNGANPIGKTFRTVAEPGYPEAVYEIVGLVKDTRYQNLREQQQAICFAPFLQHPLGGRPSAQIIIRSSVPLAGLIPVVKRTIAEQSPDIVLQFQVFKAMVRERLVTDRVMAALSGAFGFLAAMLAMIGLYGVMSYMVARRRNEIGIRIALGAARRDIMTIVLREAGLLLAIGLTVGTGLSVAAATTARKLLFGLEPNDPKTLAMAIGAMAVVALAASYVPALRAARLDPMVALRDE